VEKNTHNHYRIIFRQTFCVCLWRRRPSPKHIKIGIKNKVKELIGLTNGKWVERHLLMLTYESYYGKTLICCWAREGTCFLMWVNKTESLDQYIALRLIAINVHTHSHSHTQIHTHTLSNTHTHTHTHAHALTSLFTRRDQQLLMVCMHFVSYCVCLLSSTYL